MILVDDNQNHFYRYGSFQSFLSCQAEEIIQACIVFSPVWKTFFGGLTADSQPLEPLSVTALPHLRLALNLDTGKEETKEGWTKVEKLKT